MTSVFQIILMVFTVCSLLSNTIMRSFTLFRSIWRCLPNLFTRAKKTWSR